MLIGSGFSVDDKSSANADNATSFDKSSIEDMLATIAKGSSSDLLMSKQRDDVSLNASSKPENKADVRVGYDFMASALKLIWKTLWNEVSQDSLCRLREDNKKKEDEIENGQSVLLIEKDKLNYRQLFNELDVPNMDYRPYLNTSDNAESASKHINDIISIYNNLTYDHTDMEPQIPLPTLPSVFSDIEYMYKEADDNPSPDDSSAIDNKTDNIFEDNASRSIFTTSTFSYKNCCQKCNLSALPYLKCRICPNVMHPSCCSTDGSDKSNMANMCESVYHMANHLDESADKKYIINEDGDNWICLQHQCCSCKVTENLFDKIPSTFYRCDMCIKTYCGNCLPQDTVVCLLGITNQMKSLNYVLPENICYILCSLNCLHHSEQQAYQTIELTHRLEKDESGPLSQVVESSENNHHIDLQTSGEIVPETLNSSKKDSKKKSRQNFKKVSQGKKKADKGNTQMTAMVTEISPEVQTDATDAQVITMNEDLGSKVESFDVDSTIPSTELAISTSPLLSDDVTTALPIESTDGSLEVAQNTDIIDPPVVKEEPRPRKSRYKKSTPRYKVSDDIAEDNKPSVPVSTASDVTAQSSSSVLSGTDSEALLSSDSKNMTVVDSEPISFEKNMVTEDNENEEGVGGEEQNDLRRSRRSMKPSKRWEEQISLTNAIQLNAANKQAKRRVFNKMIKLDTKKDGISDGLSDTETTGVNKLLKFNLLDDVLTRLTRGDAGRFSKLSDIPKFCDRYVSTSSAVQTFLGKLVSEISNYAGGRVRGDVSEDVFEFGGLSEGIPLDEIAEMVLRLMAFMTTLSREHVQQLSIVLGVGVVAVISHSEHLTVVGSDNTRISNPEPKFRYVFFKQDFSKVYNEFFDFYRYVTTSFHRRTIVEVIAIFLLIPHVQNILVIGDRLVPKGTNPPPPSPYPAGLPDSVFCVARYLEALTDPIRLSWWWTFFISVSTYSLLGDREEYKSCFTERNWPLTLEEVRQWVKPVSDLYRSNPHGIYLPDDLRKILLGETTPKLDPLPIKFRERIMGVDSKIRLEIKSEGGDDMNMDCDTESRDNLETGSLSSQQSRSQRRQREEEELLDTYDDEGSTLGHSTNTHSRSKSKKHRMDTEGYEESTYSAHSRDDEMMTNSQPQNSKSKSRLSGRKQVESMKARLAGEASSSMISNQLSSLNAFKSLNSNQKLSSSSSLAGTSGEKQSHKSSASLCTATLSGPAIPRPKIVEPQQVSTFRTQLHARKNIHPDVTAALNSSYSASLAPGGTWAEGQNLASGGLSRSSHEPNAHIPYDPSAATMSSRQKMPPPSMRPQLNPFAYYEKLPVGSTASASQWSSGMSTIGSMGSGARPLSSANSESYGVGGVGSRQSMRPRSDLFPSGYPAPHTNLRNMSAVQPRYPYNMSEGSAYASDGYQRASSMSYGLPSSAPAYGYYPHASLPPQQHANTAQLQNIYATHFAATVQKYQHQKQQRYDTYSSNMYPATSLSQQRNAMNVPQFAAPFLPSDQLPHSNNKNSLGSEFSADERGNHYHMNPALPAVDSLQNNQQSPASSASVPLPVATNNVLQGAVSLTSEQSPKELNQPSSIPETFPDNDFSLPLSTHQSLSSASSSSVNLPSDVAQGSQTSDMTREVASVQAKKVGSGRYHVAISLPAKSAPIPNSNEGEDTTL